METSSSLSQATMLALSVAGTQMSTLLGHTGWGDVRIAESRDGEAGWGSLPHSQVYQQEEGCGIFPGLLGGEESPRCFGDKGKRRSNTSYQPFTLSERKRLKMAFGLEPGKLCNMGSSWTSWRSRGSYNTHSMGKEKARRPEGITQLSMAGTSQPCRSGTIPGCNVCCGSVTWQGQV